MNLTKPQKTVYNMEKFAGGSISVICGSILVEGNLSCEEIITAVNKLYMLNDALRVRIIEDGGKIEQHFDVCGKFEIPVLNFESKTEFEEYAEDYAKDPLDFYGRLSDIQAVVLPEQFGILIKLHHIVGDAWTLSLIGTQFCDIISGNTPVAYSYSEYITGEEAYFQSKRYEKDRAFFIDKFAKCGDVTYLSEKQSNSYISARKTYVIERREAEALRHYAQANETTVYAVMMTAFATYMSRIKLNAEKFFVGTAVLNRSTAKEKNTAGMFINSVPVLTELDNEKTFAENLNVIEQSLLSVFRHQKYNYSDLLEDIRKKYNFSEKLYDVLISFQNAAIETSLKAESKWYHSGMQIENLQIHIDDRNNTGTYNINFDYRTDLFSESEISDMFERIRILLMDAVLNGEKKIRELEILSPIEKEMLLHRFNDTAADYPRDKCVHQIFEEQVEKTPDKIAVIDCDRTITYRELNEEANRIAHSLVKTGICVGDIVAFALPRKSYLISTIFAILKVGAAYLPIDPDYPEKRIDYILKDSNAKLFVTEESIAMLLCNDNISNLSLDISSESLCYCMYTSGSTGNPKGALLKHKGIVNLVTNLGIYKNLARCKRIGFMTTITFDVASQEIFTTLLNGFTGVFFPERKETKVDDIIGGIVNNSVDIIYATPTYFDSLTSSASRAEKMLSAVKVVALAGEKFYLNDFVLQCANNKDVIFENQYGPVELHVIATSTSLESNDFDSIGKPIGNNRAYIVDKYLNPTPVGVIGELCIAGDGVGAGYLNRPELTAERFIENQFGDGKLYKTGDLACWREDGNIAYVGRNDSQVKIRGLRIELSEIENEMVCVEGISQAAVVVRKNQEGRQLICAFYAGSKTDAKEIRTEIGKKLPKYMIPHIFTHINEIPLTSSGKISRKALPDVDLYNINTAVEYIAPQNEKEVILANAIQSLLNVERVGMLDNFFDLGGDSLKIIELISKLELQRYSVDTKTVFKCNTIKELAENLSVVENSEEIKREYAGDVPATSAQMRVYTAQSLNTDSTTYNVPYAFRVGDLDSERLQQAVNALIARHEALRTWFSNKDGQIIQRIDAVSECVVEQLESEDISAFIRPFDLSKAPLMRVGYYKNTIMIDLHHIITDGGSMPVFFRELNNLYMGRVLPENATQYRQFAVENIDYTEDEKYWQSVYEDQLPELDINTDNKRAQKQSFNGSAIYDTVDSTLNNKIIENCRKLGVTPFAYYIAAFNVLLNKFSSSEDISVGMPISGRESKYLNTIGMFVNTIALRSHPVGTKTVAEFLNEVKEISIEAISHQNYPYGELVKKLGIQSSERNPIFDVMFAYQSEQMTDIVFGDKKAELIPIPMTTSKYDFTFNVMPMENNVVIMVEYCTDLYKQNTIQRMIDGYKLVLKQMLDCDKKLKDISIITPEDKQLLLCDFNDTAADYPRDKCIHQIFEEQAEKTPDKTAVIACDRTITYRELNEEANRIAHSLIEKGIRTGDIVAFALPRKSYLIATIFGILKTGAIYLPFDIDYPKERIDFIISDSGAKLFITEENIESILTNKNSDNLELHISSEQPCYCIYTSGSTGVPKGVIIRHRNLVNFCSNNVKNAYQNEVLRDANVLLSISKCCFDAFGVDYALFLLNGKTLVLANDSDIYNSEKLGQLIEKNNVDVIQSTPSTVSTLIGNEHFRTAIKKLKVILVAAENFSLNLKNELNMLSNAKVFNGYGPTETTIGVSIGKIASDNIHIGKPIANAQVYILDKYMQVVPVGVTGELCVAGDGVGVGYLNRPELTAEKFVDNPFGAGKLYKTGDLAYWREDGNIVFVGRNDFQVKIRGLRIELGEIENAMSAVEGIVQALVTVRKNNDGRQLICAFYTGAELTANEIRLQIGKILPKYMLPHIFTHLDEMPLTPSGKVNRKALPEVDLYNITNDADYVAPKNELQKELCSIMEIVLTTSPVGVTDDFFELGGDSLKAIEYVSKAQAEGIYFNLQNVFDYPSVEKLEKYITNGDKQTYSVSSEDFTETDKILKKNLKRAEFVPEQDNLGNILLAGSTGFLGAHVLANYLDNDTGIAYCPVRGKNVQDSQIRLQQTMSYYFGEKYTKSDRIVVICADLQQDNFGLEDEAYNAICDKIDTVINCAASVKHYGSYQHSYEMNVDTVKRLIEFCKSAKSKLIHTSTLSVSGSALETENVNEHAPVMFNEGNLYVGQVLDNVYVRSKFEAEKAIFNAIGDGLKANIMRMGNLTNRYEDGVFQKNYKSNAFLKRIQAILELGLIPDYFLMLPAEFTPIDEAASAYMTIARNFSEEQTVFHINNPHMVLFDKLIEYFNLLGYTINTVRPEHFNAILQDASKQSDKKHIFEAFIEDMDDTGKLNVNHSIYTVSDITEQYLNKLGFAWKSIDQDYIRKYVEYFKSLAYFK